MLKTLRQWLCALCGGHDRLTHWDNNRITLRCVNCGHETPGWDLW